mgnify:FL=1
MRIEEAREEIKRIERFISLVESYRPQSFEQEAIKTYVLIESVNKTAAVLNEKGFRIGKRKVSGKDVSYIIRSKPDDELHQIAHDMFKYNKKKAGKRGWC